VTAERAGEDREKVAGMWNSSRPGLIAEIDNLAATHRSLWLGSRPRPATGKFFLSMKENILLVDDDPAVRRMLFRVLEAEDYRVVRAANGVEAVELAARESPDLTLLDLNLPSKDGWQTFERLTNEHPTMPVIIITARPNQLFPALASGVGALMEKPLDLPKMLRTIRDLLDEPAHVRSDRAAGHLSQFHYLPPKPE
jgi:CheY-like chemotaxis protein